MATVKKQKKKWYCIYRHPSPQAGAPSQPWEAFDEQSMAIARQKQVEYCIELKKPIPAYEEFLRDAYMEKYGIGGHQQGGAAEEETPGKELNIGEFLDSFVQLYGINKWGVKSMDRNLSQIRNYLKPMLGDILMHDVDEAFVDKWLVDMKRVKSVVSNGRKPASEYLPVNTRDQLFRLMRCVFNQAVRWKNWTGVKENPFNNTAYVKPKYKPRDAWEEETVYKALSLCDSGRLYIAMNLAFACSMRIGEILGLPVKQVFISDDDIQNDRARLYISQELERVSLEAIELLDSKDILHIFKPLYPNCKSRLVLKKPKTEGSIRVVFIPQTLAYILREWIKKMDEWKEILGDEYQDNGLLISHLNGAPVEQRLINEDFTELKVKNKLPNVVFHSLRVTSTQAKLIVNNGDIKAMQADGGWVNTDMITKVYTRMREKDQMRTAKLFDKQYYCTDMRGIVIPEREDIPPKPAVDMQQLIEQIQQSPDLAAQLAQALAAGAGTKTP